MSGIVDFFKAVAGICRTQPLQPELWDKSGNTITVKVSNISELQHPGGAVYMQGNGLQRPVLVVRGVDDTYHAFENRCTHGGRKLDPKPGEPVLRCCSVNHSTFDFDGNKLSGPAKGPIKVFKTEAQEDDLVIDIG
jgi:cytochrome b6-f complex iron-sulfur subunit